MYTGEKVMERNWGLLVPDAVDKHEMVFGLTKDTKKPEHKVRNWITYKLREIISKQSAT